MLGARASEFVKKEYFSMFTHGLAASLNFTRADNVWRCVDQIYVVDSYSDTLSGKHISSEFKKNMMTCNNNGLPHSTALYVCCDVYKPARQASRGSIFYVS